MRIICQKFIVYASSKGKRIPSSMTRWKHFELQTAYSVSSRTVTKITMDTVPSDCPVADEALRPERFTKHLKDPGWPVAGRNTKLSVNYC